MIRSGKSWFYGKKVLVVGGLGFIGSNLALKLLQLGARVRIVDSLERTLGGNRFNVAGFQSRLDLKIADVKNARAFASCVRGQDLLFNLVGQSSHIDSMRNPWYDLEANCHSQIAILEGCRLHNPKIKVVFAGTRQIYGVPTRLPVTEKHPQNPIDVNGIHKVTSEQYHRLYHNTYGIRTCILRLTNTYGPRMRVRDARQTFLGWWIRRILSRQEILVYGDGRQLRDLNYVDDVVDAMLLVSRSRDADGRIFNLGASPPISLRKLAELLVLLNGSGDFRTAPFPADLKKIDIGDYYGNFNRIRTVLGWKPRVDLRTGLERTLRYYRLYRHRYW